MQWPPDPQRTARLALRAATDADGELFARILTNPDVRRYLGGVIAEDELSEKIADLPGRGVFLAERRADGAPIGLIYLGRYRTGDLELSYELLPEFWGAGLAEEACAAILGWAFANFPDERRVVAVTQAANTPSLALARRLGMTPCDEFVEWDAPQVMLELHRPTNA
jgi:RimJ/RimL family protein N-acetyltransferase